MEPAPSRMAGGTSRYGLEALLFEMALLTRESHRSGRRTRVAGGAFPLQPSPSHMTLVAAERGMLSPQFPGMLELLSHFGLCRACNPGFLADDRVAEIAVFAENLSVRAHMFPLVTAEAAEIYGVADVVRMGTPVHFHLGKDVRLIDPLHLRDSLLDSFPLFWVKPRVMSEIKTVQ